MFKEAQIEAIVNTATGKVLRKEYQTTAIAGMINNYVNGTGALKVLCGCGGGKSIMMGASIILALINGAKKIVITAPTIALCRQLEDDLIELAASFALSGNKVPKGIKFFNVSSDSKQKKKTITVLTQEEIDDEHDGFELREPEQEKEVNAYCKQITASRDTSLDHKKIKKEIMEDAPSVFFVCKPSFLNSFQAIVAEVAAETKQPNIIDISCHDEFHNFISQERSDRTKNILTRYKTYSKHNWFFSASKKRGERFSWDDALFGDAIIDVPTYKLVDWGYLVPELKVFIVTAGMIKGISDAIKQYFNLLNIPNAEKFYREAAVIFKVIEHQATLKSVPKIIHFSAAVAFIRTMMASEDFKKCLHNVSNGIACYQMDGSTPKEDRADIFEQLKAATAEAASILLQHSTCKEGINCPSFNVGIIARGMSEISLQQALGRIQRVADGKNTAYLYIFVEGDHNQLAKLCQFLHYNLGTYEYSIAPITDDYIGVENDIRIYANLDGLKIKMKNGKVNIEEYIQSLRDQDVEDEIYDKYDKMTDDEFFAA